MCMRCVQALKECRKLRKLFNRQCSALKKHIAYCRKHFGVHTLKCSKAGGASTCTGGRVLTAGDDGKNHCSASGNMTRVGYAT